jgi:hypothetical protein
MANIAEIKRDLLTKRGPYTTFQDDLETNDDTYAPLGEPAHRDPGEKMRIIQF